jgi:hypothetical protein
VADKLLYLIFGAAAGAWLFQSCGPADFIAFPEVIVPAARIVEREPPPRPPTIIERIVYVAPRPVQVARAPGGASDALSAFCAPVTLVQGPDTVVVVDTVLVLRSGVYSEAWLPGRKDELRLTGFTNVGDLEERTFRTRGSFDFTTAGGSEVIVRYGRLAFVGDLVDAGAYGWSLFSLLRAGVEAFR